MKVFIYILSDPITGEVRYVGKSTSPKWRLYGHIHGRGRSNAAKEVWIASLLERGLRPIMEIIEESDSKEWRDAERQWISYLKFLGIPLLNIDAGGYGGRDNWTQEMKERVARKISEAYANNPELRERQSRNARSRKHSPESIEKMRAIKKALAQTPEWKAKMEVVVARSVEVRRHKMSLLPPPLPKVKMPRKPMPKWTEERRVIMRQKMTGRKPTPETVEKLRASTTRMWATPETRARIHNAILKKHGHAIQENQS